ncbi:hypothetical protein GCM10009716_13560 [Streptomyces sodiiphilus]|uniref:Lanthionine synthetase n=1 Tax=Streptomyces sodiiphilus TaxID=226217 RepID=A0ABP5A655_9ACTN
MPTPTDLFTLADDLAGRLAIPAPVPEPWTSQCLATGAAGIALLHIERAHTGRATWHQAHTWIKHAVTADISASDVTGLYLGAPAAAFMLHTALSPDSPRYRNALAAIDRHVNAGAHRRITAAEARRRTGRRPAFREYDLFYGLTGIGAYLLRRDPGCNALGRILDYLVTLTWPLRGDDGTTLPGWWVDHDPNLKYSTEFAGGHANFGTAHGIAGPLMLLAQAMRQGITVEGHTEAIATILTWLDSWQQNGPAGPWWPEHITLPELRTGRTLQPAPARPSWCYGTPGLARACQLAAIATGDPGNQHSAEHALVACLNDPVQTARLTDPGLCHGWAGVYQTAWRAAHDAAGTGVRAALPSLADALARHAQSTPGRGAGLLQGEAGTALALTTAATEAAPTSGWDACLLIN